MLLSEDRVKNAVIVQLAKMGYLPVRIKAIRERGVDIVARHRRYGRYFLVEVKGDPSKNVKSPGAGRDVHFIYSVGQLMTRIVPERGYYYGLAYPISYRKLVMHRLPSALMKKLHIHLFFVSESLRVEVVKWREVRGVPRKSKLPD